MLDALHAAVRLAEQVGMVVVEARTHAGLPRVACARQLSALEGSHVALGGWFSPHVATELGQTGGVDIVVWDEAAGAGYQISGSTEEVADRGSANPGHERGVTPSADGWPELYVRVEKITAFGAERATAAPPASAT